MLLPFENSAFTTVYADPPWPEVGAGVKGGRRGADRHYPLMSFREIEAMGVEVRRISQPNSHLYLWVTNRFLPQGLSVMTAWGYEYRTIITWGKDRFGLGQYFRGQSEQCLFGVRGNIPYRLRSNGVRAQGTTLILAPRQGHSQKPEQMRQMIELVSPGPYLELFARCAVPEWAAWGNEELGSTTLPMLTGLEL